MMGRAEPCVLFAQTFMHSQLDEYVDEVAFSEPVVVTACEFLEQGALSGSPLVTFSGATAPPSFALEIFVQCEGEVRFKRLCQPFLYSHSSSNILEVEAVVTNHLIVRGSYRSLSLVIHGNTAEDLGQLNIDFDMDSSLNNLVSSSLMKIEDLHPLLQLLKPAIEESVSLPMKLTPPRALPDISDKMKQLLQRAFQIVELSNVGDAIDKVLSNVISVASSDVASNFQFTTTAHTISTFNDGELDYVLENARKELLGLYKELHDESSNESFKDSMDCTFAESEFDFTTSKDLVDLLTQYIQIALESFSGSQCHLLQSKNVILGLSLAFLLCSGRESCFHFVSGGGLQQLSSLLSYSPPNSAASTLMLLGVVERATRHSVGCEGFLGWWPRQNNEVPPGSSNSYNQLLRLLLQKQRHDIAIITIYVLHRLHFYEILSKYECTAVRLLEGISSDCGAPPPSGSDSDNLVVLKSHLRKLLDLLHLCGPIEDPSPVACARRSLILGKTEVLLSYESTCSFIFLSKCSFSHDIDSHLLELLKETGFLPLSVALMASSTLHMEDDIGRDITSYFVEILLMLLFCRSGLIFLLLNPELSATLILALSDAKEKSVEECIPLCYASVLASNGFDCSIHDIGVNIEMHLRVVSAIDRMLTMTSQSEEFLWVLWELCAFSRSECGREALLSIVHFPEAISLLIEALNLSKDIELVSANNGHYSPLNVAIFHSAAEIFEVIVKDSTTSSLCWIEYATEIYSALHSSSPGSNRKDSPARLLDWIDACVVYHKSGAVGLLQYAAVLVSGGDSPFSSSNIRAPDSVDTESAPGESGNCLISQAVENLGKLISDKIFEGLVLLESSMAQLTTSLRILAFISENSVVAGALYDEGATIIIHAILMNCSFMLERSSNSYGYLVDEGSECNSTSDLLLERNRERGLVDLLVPTLVLLISILQKLQESNEQHRNTKLMSTLLRLHREVSPKLATYAADTSIHYPDMTLRLGAVCHLVVSALSCWPIYGWTPGIFHSLLANVNGASLLALGPKEACWFLCLMNDMLPDEGVSLWVGQIPLMSTHRTLAVGTLLGPTKEKQVNWYLHSEHLEILLNQMKPHLEKIGQIILDCAITSLIVIRDMLRVLIIRIAHQNGENAYFFLRPIVLWIRDRISDPLLSDIDIYKVYQMIDFIGSLLEHPCSKPLLLKEDIVQMIVDVLERGADISGFGDKTNPEQQRSSNSDSMLISWFVPTFRCISLMCVGQPSLPVQIWKKHDYGGLSAEDCTLFLCVILRLCQVLPVGKELFACLTSFKALGSCSEGRNALLTISSYIISGSKEGGVGEQNEDSKICSIIDKYEWLKCPPLHACWTNLLDKIKEDSDFSNLEINIAGTLCSGSLYFCIDEKSFNSESIGALKCLFGFTNDWYMEDGMLNLINSKILDCKSFAAFDNEAVLSQVSQSVKTLQLLLQETASADSVNVEDIFASTKPRIFEEREEEIIFMGVNQMSEDSYFSGGFKDRFMWECPETLPDRFSNLTPAPLKRKMAPLDNPSRRSREPSTDLSGQSSLSRSLGLPSASTVSHNRRDSFRQRKPNTSRPPSMHVDDYVARERSVEATTSASLSSLHRTGSSGRPPSIHVDEFMARQRERQIPGNVSAGSSVTPQESTIVESSRDVGKVGKSKQARADFDDDLHEIDIVFDGDDSDADDRLPFPQPDDTPPQPETAVSDQCSPVYESAQSDVGGSGGISSTEPNIDDFIRSGIPLHQQSSQHPDDFSTHGRKLFEQIDEVRDVSVPMSNYGESIEASGSPFVIQGHVNATAAPHIHSQSPVASWPVFPNNNLMRNIFLPGEGVLPNPGSPAHYDQKTMSKSQSMPSVPPVHAISHGVPQRVDPFPNKHGDMQIPLSSHIPFHVPCDITPIFNNSPASQPSIMFPVSTFGKQFISPPIGPIRQPPLPPTPPPFFPTASPLQSSAVPSSFYSQTSFVSSDTPLQLSSSSSTDSGLPTPLPGIRFGAYHSPSASPALPLTRPPLTHTVYSGSPLQQPIESITSITQTPSVPQTPILSMHTVSHLQPLQPPQLLLTPQPPQHSRSQYTQVSQQIEQSVLSNPHKHIQVPMPQLHMPQQPSSHMSAGPSYPNPPRPASVLPARQHKPTEQHNPQSLNQGREDVDRKKQVSGMSLQEYFSSPEAIQSLITDREKLCQLLEQHPKLMQMLQEELDQM